MSTLNLLLGSGAGAVIIAAIVGLIGTFRSLHANKPITEATADEKTALANASSFTAQQGVINTLNAQLDRQNLQIERQEKQIERQETKLRDQDRRIGSLEEKVKWATARVEERDEQNELLSAQLRASRDENTLLTENLRTCRKSGQAVADWMREHYAKEHPGEPAPNFRIDVGGT